MPVVRYLHAHIYTYILTLVRFAAMLSILLWAIFKQCRVCYAKYSTHLATLTAARAFHHYVRGGVFCTLRNECAQL